MNFLNELIKLSVNNTDNLKNECRQSFYSNIVDALKDSIKEAVSNGNRFIKGEISFFDRHRAGDFPGCKIYCINERDLPYASKSCNLYADLKSNEVTEIVLFKTSKDITSHLQCYRNEQSIKRKEFWRVKYNYEFSDNNGEINNFINYIQTNTDNVVRIADCKKQIEYGVETGRVFKFKVDLQHN